MIQQYLKAALTLSFLSSDLFGCSCDKVDSAAVKRLINEHDFVAIGHATENVGEIFENVSMWNSRRKGYQVRLKVDSVIKGDRNTTHIVVVQFWGTCDRLFTFGQRILVFGSRINEYQATTGNVKQSPGEDMPPTSVPPPIPHIINHTVVDFSVDQETLTFWNNIAKQETVVSTSLCTSFIPESGAGRLVLRTLNHSNALRH